MFFEERKEKLVGPARTEDEDVDRGGGVGGAEGWGGWGC